MAVLDGAASEQEGGDILYTCGAGGKLQSRNSKY